MATVPAVYFAPVRFSSLNLYPGPPLPVPRGSPHCSTYSGLAVVSRWQCVLLKYFWPARYTNELTVQVALLFSRSMTTSPRLVRMVAWYLARQSGLVGGLPTLRAAVPDVG